MAEQSIPDSGVRDAAVFLLSLGEESAAEVLKHLGAKDVQRIGAAMSDVGQLSRVQVTQTLDRFLQEVETQVSVGVGTDEFIRTMLTKALGEDKASGLIDRILFGRSSKGLEMLKWMDARGVADNIRNEHPQTIAVVLAYLDADQAAEALSRLPENMRAEVVARIAGLDGVQPSALSQLDEVIERQFSGKVATRTASLGGAKAAANIINNMEISQEGALLGQLREMDETLASTIEELIFTFDDLMDIEDRDFQELLRQVPNDQIVPALKAAEESMRNKFFKNISQRAAATLKEDLEARGPIKISEAEAAQKLILTLARKLAEAGTISLGSKGADSYV
jgi:flagellar motor switch protein FliG